MPAYLARPDASPRPAVIVLQEIFGVNTEIRRITDLVASAGYVAVAINYYHRSDPNFSAPYTPEGMQLGYGVAGKTTKADLRADLSATIAWLDAQSFVQRGKVVTWGFCYGGTVAFLSATVPGVRGAISFYGTSITRPLPGGEPEALSEADKVQAPLLIVYGGDDESVPPDAIGRVATTLTAAHKEFTLKVYPKTGHAFFRQSSQQLNETVVADAWNLVQNFLSRF